MNKTLLFTLLKTALTFVGSYLVGKNLFGNTLDTSVIETLIGVVMALASTAWSFFDKSYTIESIQAVVRQVISVIGGLLVASGKLSEDTLKLVDGFILTLVPLLQSILSKKKAEQIQEGVINPSGLKTLKN